MLQVALDELDPDEIVNLGDEQEPDALTRVRARWPRPTSDGIGENARHPQLQSPEL